MHTPSWEAVLSRLFCCFFFPEKGSVLKGIDLHPFGAFSFTYLVNLLEEDQCGRKANKKS